jgi:uncharacterized protein (DUF1697 family)
MLRGINVSGRNKVPMADLRSMAGSLGYLGVRSYVQSGNLVFDAPGRATPASVASRIGGAVRGSFGVNVPVVVRTGDELAGVVAANPFAAEGLRPDDEPRLFHVTFLDSAPDRTAVAGLEAAAEAFRPDVLRVAAADVYLHIPGGYGETKLNNAFLERKLGGSATTRNWKTVTTLAAMAAEGA